MNGVILWQFVSMQGSPIAQSCTCLVRLSALVAGYIEHLLHLISVAAITLVSIAVAVSFRLWVSLMFFRTLLLLTNHLEILLYRCLLVALLLLNPHPGLLGTEVEYSKALYGKNAVRIFLYGELIVKLTYGGAPVV